MGPQSSGKSTLLNNLFHTKFKEMEAADGRTQTTQGIWMDKCVSIQPFTIVMDLESSDGRERGQDDTTFEKQSALFALAVSDIVIINMWCNEIGREQAANKPLLRAVFQAMIRMFGNTRKTTLLFVLRDKSKTPIEKLKPVLEQDIEKIWNEVPKRVKHKKTRLDEIFNIEVVALSSYERDEDMFKEEVATLRKRFVNSTSPGGLTGDRRGHVPASAFLHNIKNVWEVIKDDRDLDLPSHKLCLPANTRCEEILDQQLSKLIQDEDWLNLKKSAENGLVPDLVQRLRALLDSCLKRYENEASYFDETVMRSKRELLKSKVLEVLHPAFATTLGHLRSKVFQEFKSKLNDSIEKGDELFESVIRTLTENSISEFDKGTADAGMENVRIHWAWDVSIVRDKLRSEIEAYPNSLHKEIRFKEHADLMAELKNMKFQNQEQSRESKEQINRLLEIFEARQKADEEHIKNLEDLRAQDQEKLNALIKMRTKDQAQLEELLKSLARSERKLSLGRKWGPFEDEATGKGETFEDEATGNGEPFEDEATGNVKTFEDEATGNVKTFEDEAAGNGETFEDEATGNGETFKGDDDATGQDFDGDALYDDDEDDNEEEEKEDCLGHNWNLFQLGFYPEAQRGLG